MKKKEKQRWHWVLALITVSALRFLACSGSAAENGGEDELFVQLREAQMARRAAEERALTLNAERIRADREAAELRAALAELSVTNDGLRRQVEVLRLHAANLLLAGNEEPETKYRRWRETINQLRADHSAAYKQLSELRSYLNSVLDLVDPDAGATYRKVLNTQLQRLFQQLEGSATRLAEPSDDPPAERLDAARILDVNDDLQVAVLDKGRGDGVRPGMRWSATDAGGRSATLRTIEARARISAAIVLQGQLGLLAPGVTARLNQETELKQP